MTTPICDFVRRYAEGDNARLHMPGHKGAGVLGVEALDITEIPGADSLYEADGIIAESEQNASVLFGCPTFYSTEGSSHAIRAMLYLLMQDAHAAHRRPLIWAARNAHKTFLSALALLDADVVWLPEGDEDSYLCSRVDAEMLDKALKEADEKPSALYLTSPDYLGNVADIAAIADVCHRYGTRLAVDNAHGAYLQFLSPSLHPIAQGADICCDSAHKTLPVLTGGAYLHLSPRMPRALISLTKTALSLFGSTSPSYLILQSLDAANAALANDIPRRLATLAQRLDCLKVRLAAHGYTLLGNEPLKLTILPKSFGYDGCTLAATLRESGIECEFCDPDALVLMPSVGNSERDLDRLERALLSIVRRQAITDAPPPIPRPARVMSVRAAMLAPCEWVAASDSLGRILSAPSVGCPPAVPIVMSGERIDAAAIDCFSYYGIERCLVVK